MSKITIKNYRQIGIKEPAVIDVPDYGGLLVLLGENNVGKTNVLNAINALQQGDLKKSDRPNFLDFEDFNKTEITLTQKFLNVDEFENEEDNKLFLDKNFGVIFTQSSLKTASQKHNLTEEQYIEKLNDEFETSEIYALHDLDDSQEKPMEEIRIILPEYKKVYRCSTKRGGDLLECFGAFDKDFDKVKNHQKAKKLSCKFRFFIDKNESKEEILDDAKELKIYLNDEFKNSDVKNAKNYQTYEFKIWLNNENVAAWNTTYPWFEAFDRIKNEFQKLLKWHIENSKNRQNEKQIQIFEELSQDVNSAIFHRDYDKFERYYNRLCEILTEFLEYHNRSFYYDKKLQLPKFVDMKILVDDIRLKDTMPNIIFYKEQDIKNENLKTTPNELDESIFFNALFNAIEFDMSKVKKSYEKSKDKNTNFYKTIEKDINKVIQNTINKRFNELYYAKSNSDIYGFEINLEAQNISFSITKNSETISLNEQSVGFKKFFNLFFNFLYNYNFGWGDIVLIDEVETHLSIPAQKDIRKFLKEFGYKNGITFIVSTYSNHILDIKNLDEIRIVKPDKIINDFSIIAENEADTLLDIKQSLGVNYLGVVGYDKKLVFVEGITDYNYLTTMSFVCKNDELVFLPIGGLGSFGENGKSSDEIVVTEIQKGIRDKLKSLARLAKDSKALLLVDDDRAGKAMKQLEDDKFKVAVINEVFEDRKFKEIEDFFSDDLRAEFEIYKKSSTISSNFKNNVVFGDSSIDSVTKERFNKIFDYLMTY